MNYRVLVSCLLFVFSVASSSTFAQAKDTKVTLKNSDHMFFDQKINPDAQLLVGNVKFVHNDIVMFCDSAYFYQKTNSLDAFGNVHIIRGDSLHIYSDRLFYDGNLQIAQFRYHVRTFNEHGSEVLTTDSLNYERLKDVAYYFTGGKLVDSVNVLTSIVGEYHPQINTAYFLQKVFLDNKDFKMYTDTLDYNTETKVATIHGPTNIYTTDTTHIYAELGYYDTQKRFSELQKKAVIYSKEHTIRANKLQYNELKSDMHAYGNMSILDTIQHTIIKGEEGYFNQHTQYAMAKDRALCMEFSTPDTFYIHADKFEVKADSIYKRMFGYHHVRFYRIDIQGKCDSLEVITRDSVVKMFTAPMLWSGENQIYGDSISIFSKNGTINRVEVLDNAFIVSQVDSVRFNQIKGNKIIGYIQDNEMKQMDVDGSVQTIYFPLDKDSSLIGENVAQSSYLTAYLKHGAVEKLILKPQSNGTLFPPGGLEGPDLYIKGYTWAVKVRPLFPMDVFRKP